MSIPRDLPHPARMTALRREVCVSLAVRAILATVGAIICVVAAVMVAQSGTENHPFPIVVDGQLATVTAYSGPHWAAAIGLGALAGLLLVSALTDTWRRHVIVRHSRTGDGAR